MTYEIIMLLLLVFLIFISVIISNYLTKLLINKCPYCKKIIDKKATICPFCQSKLMNK